MTKQILVIDDSKTQLSSLKLILTKAGYDVITANDGSEGIKAAYKHMPDLIVSDILMPNLNGYHLCRLLKDDKKTKNIPIVLLTVLNSKLDKFWGIRAGADAYFQKDSDYGKLIEEFNKLISKNDNNKNETEIITIKENTHVPDYRIKVTEILDQSLIESTIMNEFRDLSEFVLDSKTLNKRLFSLLSSIIDYNLAGVFFNDKDIKKDKVVFLGKNDYEINENVLKQAKTDFFNTIFNDPEIEKKFSTEYHISEKNIEKSETIDNYSVFQSRTIIPITYEDELIGGLALYHRLPNKYNPSKIFNIVLNELKLLMRIKWLYSKTRFLAITDPLTGLYNRRYFQQILEREFSRSNRYNTPLSLAMMDIDNFKKLNDTYGHLFGDEVIATISRMMSESLRKTDYVSRYGGEELVAVLPETRLEQAIIPLERFRQKIESHSFMYDEKKVNVTISIGIAQNDDHIITSDSFIQKADNALYKAKQQGKNRIELSTI